MNWLIGLALLVSLPCQAQDLTSKFDKIIKSHGFSKDQLGLAVIDLIHAPQQLQYGLNEEKDMIPASITKVATAFAVLQKLGASYKFQTGLYSSAPIKDGVLKGDLILKGGGDAGFVSETMWFLVNEFVRTGVKKIEGNILVDDSDFDSVRTDPSRDPVRVDRAYDAPVGAMSFNWNSINIFVRPTKGGAAAEVFLDPIDFGFKIDNKARTGGKSGGGAKIDVTRSGNKILVRGVIAEGAPEFVVYKNIDDPADWAGRNLIFFLSQRGIGVSGKVKNGKIVGAARLLAKADSKPVSQHVSDMMKFSNNYVAEMLTKNLALAEGVRPATLNQGMGIIRSVLTDAGISSDRFTLVNPSGLSRQNKMKAVDLAKLLVKSYQHFPTFAESLAALPLAGVDGTLKNRMKETAAQGGWVRAKTGLLTGVVGLAGFAGRRDGTTRAFAFVFNGKGEQGDMARRMFDALASELVQ